MLLPESAGPRGLCCLAILRRYATGAAVHILAPCLSNHKGDALVPYSIAMLNPGMQQ